MGATTDTAITATTIGITITTIIIVTGLGLPLSTVAPATTATIETSPLFEVTLVLVRLDHSVRFASSNGITSSTFPVESKIRTSFDHVAR
jgi:hypothetical protein